VSNQSISPSECSTYSKIKDLYGEGGSKEEIAETLELPLDVVCGFLSGNYTIISACPEPYQSIPLSEGPTYSKRAKENDNQNITKLRQEIETQMEKTDDRELDLIMGKCDRSPGVKDYEPPKVPMPKPTPPTSLREISPVFTDTSSASPTHVTVSTASPNIGADYQIFGKWAEWMTDKSYLGRVWSCTESVQYLKNDAKEWHVMHQYEADAQSNIKAENAIMLWRQDDTAICGPFLSSLGSHQTSDYKYYPANHIISIGIRPEHSSGSREYDEVYMWIWDRTDGVSWGKTYTLPRTEKITIVDAALECDKNETPDSTWKNLYKFNPSNEHMQNINLLDEFTWAEHPSPVFNNEHAEEYYDDYGPSTVATLWQRKTPVGDSYEPDNSFDQYSTMSVTSSLQSQSRSIDPAGDNDYIRFYAQAGKKYIFYTEGSTDT
jgi:hypothetical protein